MVIPSNIYPFLFALAFMLTVLEFINRLLHLLDELENEPKASDWIIFFVIDAILVDFLFAISYAAGIVLFELR